jgi:hypothetical protein
MAYTRVPARSNGAASVHSPRSVATLIWPGVTPLGVIDPVRVFDLANRFRKISTIPPSRCRRRSASQSCRRPSGSVVLRVKAAR